MTHKSQPNWAKPCAPLTLRLWPDTLSLPSGADEGTCNLIAACMMVFAIEFFVPALPASLGNGVGLAQHGGARPSPAHPRTQRRNRSWPITSRRLVVCQNHCLTAHALHDCEAACFASLCNYWDTSRRAKGPPLDLAAAWALQSWNHACGPASPSGIFRHGPSPLCSLSPEISYSLIP